MGHITVEYQAVPQDHINTCRVFDVDDSHVLSGWRVEDNNDLTVFTQRPGDSQRNVGRFPDGVWKAVWRT